jgi:hypothetical protein
MRFVMNLTPGMTGRVLAVTVRPACDGVLQRLAVTVDKHVPVPL